jgi:hypothetical protein
MINGDTQWYDAMMKEMQNVWVAFDIKLQPLTL